MEDGRVFATMTKGTVKAEDSGRVLAVAEVAGWVYGTDLASLVALHVYYYIPTARFLPLPNT